MKNATKKMAATIKSDKTTQVLLTLSMASGAGAQYFNQLPIEQTTPNTKLFVSILGALATVLGIFAKTR